ncbi:MAG: fructose-6-phosphate aldolase [Candidatus Kapabacteria bacterium]|jgi:transaldolase|nr:fructose-6-phosphate aldolase [Candidatus Kapabacteria bacterium]
MQLYVDSANLADIRAAAALGCISGVTTNPSLLAKEDPSLDVKALLLDIHRTVGGHTSVEVVSTDSDGMLREADEILQWFPEATIKIPFIPAGLTAVRKLADQGIPTNVTLLFTANQALIAANAGATYVSVFLGRLDDISTDGVQAVRDTAEIWDTHGMESLIIAASIRNPLHLLECARAGAHIATVPYKVLLQSMKHPLTDAGLEAFLNDYKAMVAKKGS